MENSITIIPPPAYWFEQIKEEKNETTSNTCTPLTTTTVAPHDHPKSINNIHTLNSVTSTCSNNTSSSSSSLSIPYYEAENHSNDNNNKSTYCAIFSSSPPLTTKSCRIKKNKKKKEWISSNKKPTKSITSSSSYYYSSSSSSSSIQQVVVQVPLAAQELISNMLRQAYHYTRLTYANSTFFGKHSLRYSEVGSNTSGYNRRKIMMDQGIRDELTGEMLWQITTTTTHMTTSGTTTATTTSDISSSSSFHLSLPAFSSLNWIDRQLVQEWRTCDYITTTTPATATTTIAIPSSTTNHSLTSQMMFQSQTHQSLMKEKDDDDVNVNHTCYMSPTAKYTVDEEDSYGSYQSDDNHTLLEQQQQQEDYPSEEEEDDDDTMTFEQAKVLMPKSIPRPSWEKASTCYTCQKLFSPTLLRHHCRFCGRSYCHTHSRFTHKLPHVGYDPDVPERVCTTCKQLLDSQTMAERIAWRIARCRDYFTHHLQPYFDTGVDSFENAVYRVTKGAIQMAKSIPLLLGTQAKVGVEVLDCIRKHGIHGLYGLILRREFLEAAELLCKVTGINKSTFPLSFVDLTAAIFYSLAQQRALRGIDPEQEHRIHSIKKEENNNNNNLSSHGQRYQGDVLDLNDDYDPLQEFSRKYTTTTRTFQDPRQMMNDPERNIIDFTIPRATTTSSSKNTDENKCQENLSFIPVCDQASDTLLASLIFYAPIALTFMYATTEVDMQILAAQQGWRLVYAHLRQDADGPDSDKFAEMPGFALFVHPKYKIACLGIRGTVSMNDVVTDIRALPVTFPEMERFSSSSSSLSSSTFNHDMYGSTESIADEACWTTVPKGQGLALCGMAGASYNLFHENIDALTVFARRGYRIRITGHSLGGAVATLLGSLIRGQLRNVLKNEEPDLDNLLRVYSYGSPACVDAKLSDFCQSYVTTCVCHDDVIPRLTPTSIRGLLKHLLYIKSTWVNKNLSDDLLAITRRVKTGWAPKLRNGFTLLSTPASTLKACKKKFRKKQWQPQDSFTCTSSEYQHFTPNESSEKSSWDLANISELQVGLADTSSTPSTLTDGGIYYDGDCFFEVEEEIVEESDDESNNLGDDCLVPDMTETTIPSDATERKVEIISTDKNEPQPVLMEEIPLPRMYLPGKIVHIYTHRGGYKAAIVPRTFRELRRISMAGNMLNDHLTATYYSALLECMSIRRASERLPEWTGFNEDTTCSCCSSSFTWASTSDSEAQEARDKHNCRSCGALVCDSCSKNRISVPSIGFTAAVRVCNACYNNLRIRLSDADTMTRSIHESMGESLSDTISVDGDARRTKRSTIVDELAENVFRV